MTNVIVILAILVILSLSIIKIVNEKRRGAKCIGCPYGGTKDKNGCSCG